MSPLARSLLALAAAALVHAACASHCATVVGGEYGNFRVVVSDFHLDQTDSVNDLPPEQCGYLANQVGVMVTACDPYAAPELQLQDNDRRVHITCAWNDRQLCPLGIDVSVEQRCGLYIET